MNSKIIIGIAGLPLILCSCFPWSPLPHRPMNNNLPQVEDKQKTAFVATMKEVGNTFEDKFTILGYLPSIDCSSPQIVPLGATNPWVSAYQMSCKITDKKKAQEELAYVEKIFSAGSSFWDGIQFSQNQNGTLTLSDDTAIFKLERINGLASNQSELFFKSREASYNFAQKVQGNIGEIKPSNISVKESLSSFPVSIQKYFQTLTQAESKVISSTANGYGYSKLWIGTAVPIPEGKYFFQTKWPTINNEAYTMTIIYTGSKIPDWDKAEMDFLANPRNVEAVYLESVTGDSSFLLKGDVLK